MVRDGLSLGDELDDLGGLVVGVAVVLVVLFPLPDEKNVDVKTIFTCSQTCCGLWRPAPWVGRRPRYGKPDPTMSWKPKAY